MEFTEVFAVYADLQLIGMKLNIVDAVDMCNRYRDEETGPAAMALRKFYMDKNWKSARLFIMKQQALEYAGPQS